METPAVNRQTLDNIVIDWEDEFNQLLADIKQRMLEKAASPQEAEQVNNLERIVLVYDLMMNNVIEEKGSWSHHGRRMNVQDNLKILSDKIRDKLEASPQLIQDTLSLARQKGDLVCQEYSAMIRWQWVDYLE